MSENFQLSPKELIDRQTVTEIKTYLVNTDMSVKHIASELNFEDVSYMCRYFDGRQECHRWIIVRFQATSIGGVDSVPSITVSVFRW